MVRRVEANEVNTPCQLGFSDIVGRDRTHMLQPKVVTKLDEEGCNPKRSYFPHDSLTYYFAATYELSADEESCSSSRHYVTQITPFLLFDPHNRILRC